MSSTGNGRPSMERAKTPSSSTGRGKGSWLTHMSLRSPKRPTCLVSPRTSPTTWLGAASYPAPSSSAGAGE